MRIRKNSHLEPNESCHRLFRCNSRPQRLGWTSNVVYFSSLGDIPSLTMNSFLPLRLSLPRSIPPPFSLCRLPFGGDPSLTPDPRVETTDPSLSLASLSVSLSLLQVLCIFAPSFFEAICNILFSLKFCISAPAYPPTLSPHSLKSFQFTHFKEYYLVDSKCW